MAKAFLLYLIGTTLDCNTSQTVPVRWLHLLVDFQQTAQYNWGGVALANLYTGFDAVSQAATTSFVGPWRIWQVFSLPFSFFLSHYAFAFNVLTHLLFHSLQSWPFNTSPMLYLGSLELIRKNVCESSLTAWPPSRYVFFPTPSEF
jgi:hypothetical protein